jgi:hypothetical protein
MAKLVYEIHSLYNFLAGKNIATKQSPAVIDSVLYEVVISVFNEHYDHYVKTQKISDYLLPFKREKNTDLTNGIAPVPGDMLHLRYITKEDGTQIDIIEDKFWAKRVKRMVGPVSEDRPIARIEDTGETTPTKVIEVLPHTLTTCKFYYFKKPTKPVYAYTVTGSRYVYNDAGSTDVDFDIGLLPQLTLKLLSRFGINLREQQVIMYAEQMKQLESTK